MKKTDNKANSIHKIFSIIETLVEYPNGCSLGTIVQKTGVNKSTVHRLLKTLSTLGYVTNALIEGSYRLTFKIANIGERLIHGTNIVQLSILHLTALRDATGVTVNLKLFQEDNEVILYKLEPLSGNFSTRTYMGQVNPIYCSATGKVFLAYRGEEYVRKYWNKHKSDIKKLTSNTIVDIKRILSDSKKIRKQGYAIENGENELGISCIAAPIFDIHEKIDFAISVSMQTVKLTEKEKPKLVEQLLKASMNLSRELGYRKYE